MAGVVSTENPTWVLTARSILGDDVVNTVGEHVGDLKDLMIDVNKGCIAYAVLDFGGFLGIGGKYFAVPWQSFTIDEDKKRLVLNVSKERLQQSPGFDKDHWPMSNDAAYYASVNQYYGPGTGGGMGGGGY
jgi:sporulation protein YlmC with PRC-barrel domain